jgi:multiple sugar transport system permease protein
MNRNAGFWFTLPSIVLLTIFIVYPLLSTVQMSVTDATGGFVGLENYVEITSSPRTGRATLNTLFYVGFSVLFQLLLGTAAGILLNEPFRGQGVVRALTLIPWVIPGIVAAMA